MDFTKLMLKIGEAMTHSGVWMYGFEQRTSDKLYDFDPSPVPTAPQRQLPAPPPTVDAPTPRRPRPVRTNPAATRPSPPTVTAPPIPVTGPVYNQCTFNVVQNTTNDHRRIDRSDRRAVNVKLPRHHPRDGGRYEN